MQTSMLLLLFKTLWKGVCTRPIKCNILQHCMMATVEHPSTPRYPLNTAPGSASHHSSQRYNSKTPNITINFLLKSWLRCSFRPFGGLPLTLHLMQARIEAAKCVARQWCIHDAANCNDKLNCLAVESSAGWSKVSWTGVNSSCKCSHQGKGLTAPSPSRERNDHWIQWLQAGAPVGKQ